MNISFVEGRISPYKVEFVKLNKRVRKFFKTEKEAKDFIANQKSLEKIDAQHFLSQVYSQAQLADFSQALAILPSGVSLCDCVKAYKANIPSITFSQAIRLFLQTKSKISLKQQEIYCTRLGKLAEFADFNISPQEILDWINKNVKAQKTKRHYFFLWKEFFAYCACKEFIVKNPFDNIHESEIPQLSSKRASVDCVDSLKSFFKLAERETPEFAGIF